MVDAVESLEDGLLLYDANDRLVLANRRVCELVPAVADLLQPGVRFEEVVRAAAARGYYRDAGGAVDDVVSNRLAREMRPDGRIEMHLEDGRVVQVKETRTRDGGRLILVTDITELRRTTAALEVSERNYRLMVDGVDDIIYRTDANGLFTYVNPRVEEVLGWTAEEIVGTHYLDLIDPALPGGGGALLPAPVRPAHPDHLLRVPGHGQRRLARLGRPARAAGRGRRRDRRGALGRQGHHGAPPGRGPRPRPPADRRGDRTERSAA